MINQNVYEFDPKNIPQECFGGEDILNGRHINPIKTMQQRSAYVLIYERNTVVDMEVDQVK